MRLRTQRTYLLLLFFTFILVDVSESISFAPAIGLLTKRRQIPLVLRRSASSIWNKLKSLFNNNVQKVGDKVSGISDVKDYLEFFGYLNHSSNSNFTDEITVNLQSAIAQFQENFNLDITKQLDENTYQIISQPRCRVPDIINGTNTMNYNNNVNNTTSFKPWWRTGKIEKELTLTYAFHPQNNITDDVKFLFKNAFNKWTNVTALKFNETRSFNGSNITIVFVKIDGKGGIVGGANMNYTLNVGRIYLDSEEEWVLSNKKIVDREVDLESVVMHEIGHVLGLGHSSVKEAVMYPIVLPEKKTEFVEDDDLQRIQQIYGVASLASNILSCLILSLVSSFAFMVLGFC